MLLPKKLRQTLLSLEVDEETGDWKVPFGVKALGRSYKPEDIEWLKRHHRVITRDSLFHWWNVRTKRKWSWDGFMDVMARHRVTKEKDKGNIPHLMICLKDFM